MKYKNIIIILSFFYVTNAFSQSNIPVGSRQAAMGGSGLVTSDVWSTFHNQAGLAKINGISGGVYFSNLFNNKNMGIKAFSFGMPVMKNASFGLCFTNFGYELFRESKFGLSYAMKLGKRFSAGIQIDYFSSQFALEYGKTSTIAGEIGIISEPIDNLFIAAHVFNPTFSSYNENTYKLPTILKIGVGYNFSEKVLFTVEAEKDIDFDKPIYRSGLEYNVITDFFIRAGVSSIPTEYSFGLGYNYIGIQFDISFKSHDVLGFYSQFGLSYTFKKKKE